MAKKASKTKIRPLGDKILVERMKAEEKTATGIFLPESAKEKPQQAKVVALGDGPKLGGGGRGEFQVKVGDTVLLSKWGGTEIKLGDDEYMMVSEDDLMGVVE